MLFSMYVIWAYEVLSTFHEQEIYRPALASIPSDDGLNSTEKIFWDSWTKK